MASKFHVEHDFPGIPLDVFEAYLNDPVLNRKLKEKLGFDERELVECKDTSSTKEWLFLVKKSGDMPKAIQKVIKEDSLAWHEHSRFSKNEHCIYWDISPVSKLIKFHGQGFWQLRQQGSGVKRIIEGTISVDIPLVGKIIESFIVNELVKTYEVEPAIQLKFYQDVLKKSAHGKK